VRLMADAYYDESAESVPRVTVRRLHEQVVVSESVKSR
jgi:hypothetical protein